MTTPSNNLPRYRMLVEADKEDFSHLVSEALNMGFELHGPPSIAVRGDRVIMAQAVIWKKPEEPPINPEPSPVELLEMLGR